MTALAPLLQAFFTDRLMTQYGASPHTIASYRDTFRLLLTHIANAWSLRRWRGLLYRVREVFRATGALVCLGRWLHRVPT